MKKKKTKKQSNAEALKFLSAVLRDAGLKQADIWNWLVLPLIGPTEKGRPDLKTRDFFFRDAVSKLERAACLTELIEEQSIVIDQLTDVWADQVLVREINHRIWLLRGFIIPKEFNMIALEGDCRRSYKKNLAILSLVEIVIRFARNNGSLSNSAGPFSSLCQS